MNKKTVTMIVDLQFGSTGKGLIAGAWAEKHRPDVVINANMPNAGHTYINDAGRTWIHKVLPNGIVSPELKYVMLGPGSVFSLDQLRKEFDGSSDLISLTQLVIHPDAVVLQDSHRTAEQSTLSRISSTMQGSGAALMEKMSRNPDRDNRAVKVLRNTEFAGCVKDQRAWQHIILNARCILAEGAQGYSLGLNAGFWPYCTSRDCTPSRFCADMGLPWNMLKDVIGTCRVHPIRVGNTADGYSGDHYLDQRELDWDKDMGMEPEKTTVTQRDRRIFSWSWVQFHEAMAYCAPTKIFLNFCNYDETWAASICDRIDEIYGFRPQYTGHGAHQSDIVGL